MCFQHPDCIGYNGRILTTAHHCHFAPTGANLIPTTGEWQATYKGSWNDGLGPARPGLSISGSSLTVDHSKRSAITTKIGRVNKILLCTARSPTVVAENT